MKPLSENEIKRLKPIVTELLSGESGWDECEITCLEGGITNQNYKVSSKDGGNGFVVRFFGEDSDCLAIDRHLECECSKEASRVSVAPDVLGFFPEQRALATRFVSGNTLAASDIQQEAMLSRIVRQIRTLHDQATFPGTFSAFEIARQYRDFALSRGVEVPTQTPHAFQRCAEIERALRGHERVGPCHNDLLAANFIDDGEKIWILDWEYSASGNTFFDLANFAVNNQLDETGCENVLKVYFGDIQEPQLAQLKLLMITSDLREAFWSYVQIAISNLDFDYREYAARHFNRYLEATHEIDKWRCML